MIVSKTYEVQMERPVRSVLFLHAAKDDTFMMLVMLSPGKDAVLHMDSKGKILFQHAFPRPMLTMGMLSPREGLFLDTHRHKLLLLDVQTHEFREFNHLFMFEESDQSEIVTFPSSRYLCIEEKGRYNKNKYILTYYHYPLQISQDNTPRRVDTYTSQADEWTYEHTTRRGNNHSLMIWFKARHHESFSFKTFSITGGKGQYKCYSFNRPIAGEGKVETVISNVWELRPHNYLFLCYSSKATPNSNYVVDTANKGNIRPCRFTFGPYQHQLIDCYSLGRYSMFRTFAYSHGKVLASPTYYVDNLTEEIVAEEEWKCSSSHKYELEGYGGGILCEG
jgi:hypothetical protein